MLDGVYDTTGEVPLFHPVRAPTAEQLQTLLHQIIKRVMKLLTRLGYLVEEQGMTLPGRYHPHRDVTTGIHATAWPL